MATTTAQSTWIWVSPNGDSGWKVTQNGVTFATYRTKAEAIAYGRSLAKSYRTEFVTQRMDGTIEQRDSYGNDPFPPRDRER